MSHCYNCGGRGVEGGCPECGKDIVKMNLSKLEPREVSQVMQMARDQAIPEEYIGLEWSVLAFQRSNPGMNVERNMMLKKYLHDLQNLHDTFAKGVLPTKGAIIIAPSKFSKEIFAYSCMQHALKNGFSVAPLLDTIELKRMLILAGENVHYKLDKRWDYDEYITSDVLFVTTSKTDYVKSSFMVLQELISRRSRKGLATFVISRSTIEEMSQWDKTKNFRKLSSPSPLDNMKKYPKIIMYREVIDNGGEGD